MTKNILIVDNDKSVTEKNKKQLELEGFAVTVAETAKEAREKLEQLKPDLILTEIMLENNDSGFSLCYAAKKKYPDVPVIILSDIVRQTGVNFSLNSEEEKDWIKADELIHKPVYAANLACRIKRYLK